MSRDLLAAADMFFLPSEWEGIALSVYEALACGVPVVGADVGGQRELVTLECGVLIDRGTEEDEARQYATVLARLLDEPRSNGKAWANRGASVFWITFDWSR